MTGERKLKLYINTPVRQVRQPVSLFIQSDELRKSQVEKGEAKKIYDRSILSPGVPKDPSWTKPKSQPRLFIQFGSVQKPEQEAQKAIEGQIPLMSQIGPQDPLYVKQGQKPKTNIHLEAAKHYIQSDYHGRTPGGFILSQEHHKNFMQLRKQGAQPTGEHFKQAMESLHPKYSQAMKSQNLYIQI